MNIGVIGAGYVGLTFSACLAKMGHRVICAEKDRDRLATIKEGILPFYEPGLAELVATGVRQGNLSLTDDLKAAVGHAPLVFIAVGTPSGTNGEPDLTALEEAVDAIVSAANDDQVVAIKSTVPVGTSEHVSTMLARGGRSAHVAANPEFLREGSVIDDFFHPYRVLIGTTDAAAARLLSTVYHPLACPILVTDPRTAEMIKYASNAFLATKISFINEIAMICERAHADVAEVAAGMGADPRIGQAFLKAGIGFGGSCLPKDLRALGALARRYALTPSILDAVIQVNDAQRQRFIERVEILLDGLPGKTLAVFGLAFKGGTSDLRESPALAIVDRVLTAGAIVRAFDPAAEEAAKRALPVLHCCPDAYEAAEGADAILILTEWPEFEALDWGRLRGLVRRPVVIDGRGVQVASPATRAGFAYFGPGGAIAHPRSSGASERPHAFRSAERTTSG